MKTLRRLEPNNKTYDLRDGLQARVKDPLWMLGRQWQVQEFLASNGGQPVNISVEYKTLAPDTILKKDSENRLVQQPLEDPLIPLEKSVENLSAENSPTTWDSRHLEYSFGIKKGFELELKASEYDGQSLDWYHFDMLKNSIDSIGYQKEEMIPHPIKYYGMPSARWWSHEDSRVNLGEFTRPHMNLLTMLLINFGLISSQDWYHIPIEHPIGSIRSMGSLVVTDSFGQEDLVMAAQDDSPSNQGFELFILSPIGDEMSDPTLFYFPNTLVHSLTSSPQEEVSFFRDEMANLVWGIEHKYEKVSDGGSIQVINRNEEHDQEDKNLKPKLYWNRDEGPNGSLMERPETFEEGEPGNRIEGPVPIYLEKRYPPRNWIPYLQQYLSDNIILRQGKTYLDTKQLEGKILEESSMISEEEILRAGIKITRINKLGRKSKTGEVVLWEGRKKNVDRPQPFSHLAFDQLIE